MVNIKLVFSNCPYLISQVTGQMKANFFYKTEKLSVLGSEGNVQFLEHCSQTLF